MDQIVVLAVVHFGDEVSIGIVQRCQTSPSLGFGSIPSARIPLGIDKSLAEAGEASYAQHSG